MSSFESYPRIIHPYIKPYLTNATASKTGTVKCDLIKVKGSSSRSGKGYDRFRLSVPYAGHSMNWDVVFNIESPMMCPDFNFNDDYFLSSIDDEVIRRLEQNVPTYFDWDSSDANSLLRLLMEFLVQYKAHQVSYLEKRCDRLAMEYEMMISQSEIQTEDVETILLPNVNDPNKISFHIRLALDTSKLPQSKHAENAAQLVMTYTGHNFQNCSTELILSRNLKEMIGNISPSCFTESTLLDHVKRIKSIISDRIDIVRKNHESRRAFIAEFFPQTLWQVLEYDAKDFMWIAVRLEKDNLCCTAKFELAREFPRKPPRVTLQHYYNMSEKPFTRTVDYWKPNEEFAISSIHDFHQKLMKRIINVEFDRFVSRFNRH